MLESMGSKLIPYAMDFASYLMQKLGEKDSIKNVILFGSVARGEADKKSDIDIFVDITMESNKLENDIKKLRNEFIKSAKYTQYWKMLGVDNEINVIVGELDRWEELKPSIIANGLVLYGKFKPEVTIGTHKAFFVWENIKPNAKRVLFNKQLLGYMHKKKFYNGLIQNYGGERLGKGCIVVPLDQAVVFHKLFKKYKISVKLKKVLEYG